MRIIKLGAFIMLSLCFLSGCAKKEKAVQDNAQVMENAEVTIVSLTEHIMPVVVRSCGACHRREDGNPRAVEHQVYYELKEDILGQVGTYILPDNPDESGLLKVFNQTYPVGAHKIVMPPPDAKVPKWSEGELTLFARWIEQGAEDN